MAVSRKRSSGNPDLLSTPEAAAYLHVDVRTIYRMADRGEITPLVPKGTYTKPPVRYYRRDDLDSAQERRGQWRYVEIAPYVPPKLRAAREAQAAAAAQRPEGSVA